MDDAAKLAALQVEFNEFMDSSKELEYELQEELLRAEGMNADLMKKKKITDEKLASAQTQLQETSRMFSVIQTENQSFQERLAELNKRKVELELENESLTDQNRILEATEEVLKSKVEEIEETVILVQSELEEVREEKEENEKRLKRELTDLMTEQESMVAVLEKENKNLVIQLEESEQQNAELCEEVERGGEELMAASALSKSLREELNELKSSAGTSSAEVNEYQEKIVVLEKTIADLKTALEEKDVVTQENQEQIQDLFSELEKTNDDLISASTEIAAVKAEIKIQEEKIRLKTENCEAVESKSSEQISHLEGELQALRVEYESEVAKIHKEAFDKSSAEVVSEYECKVLELQAKYDAQADALEDAKRIIKDLEIDNSTLSSTIRELKKDSLVRLFFKMSSVFLTVFVYQTPTKQENQKHTVEDLNTPNRSHHRRHSRSDSTSMEKCNGMLTSPLPETKNNGQKLSKTHSNVSVSSLPPGKYSLPPSAEESMLALKAQQKVHEKFLLDPVGSVQVSAMVALESDDVDALKNEVEELLERYVILKADNAAMLQKMQALKGNIQVCCRPRPPLEQEFQRNARGI